MIVEDRVILVAGARRHGKNTIADMLATKIKKSRRLAYAEPMKDILADTLGVSVEELEDLKNSESLPHRGYLQRFGQKAKELFGSAVWVNIIKHKIANLPKGTTTIISDFRMPIEALDGALTIKVINAKVKDTDEHISERALDSFEFDVIIVNDGTLKDLETKVDNLLTDLSTSGWLT